MPEELDSSLHRKIVVLLMAGVNSIVARKILEARSKTVGELSMHGLRHVESDIMLRKIVHETQLLQDLQKTPADQLTLRRRCVKKKCFCPYHLSQMMRERKIGVSS